MALKKSPTPLQLARLLRGAAVDKKAWDCVVIDVRDKTSLADYFVICEGETDRQVRAIADAMVQAAKEKELRPLGVDGYDGRAELLRPRKFVEHRGQAAEEGELMGLAGGAT